MPGTLIVTGGSRGIGGATAVMAGGLGFSVAVNYLQDRIAAESVVKTIVDGGGRAAAIQGDVSVEADVLRLFEESDRQLGPLTALVNNAGILETQMRVETMDAGR